MLISFCGGRSLGEHSVPLWLLHMLRAAATLSVSTLGVFGFPEKPDTEFFWPKHPLTQDRANKKISQISPVVPEEKGYKHAYIHANIMLL